MPCFYQVDSIGAVCINIGVSPVIIPLEKVSPPLLVNTKEDRSTLRTSVHGCLANSVFPLKTWEILFLLLTCF